MIQFELHDIFLVLTSLFCASALFNLALYFGYHKKTDYLFFTFYCAFHVFKIWLKTFPADLVLVNALKLTTSHLIYLSVIMGLLSLNIFLLHHYGYRKKSVFTTIFVAFSAFSYFILPENIFIYLSLLAAIFQSAISLKQQPHGWIYFSGLILLLLLTIMGTTGMVQFGYFMGTIIMIILMVISSGIQLSEQTKNLNLANLQSARLQNQLLKKSIQPHFVFNSLTSLQELIEQDPTKASKFVENLSQVFLAFSKFSNHQLVSIKEELQLVKSFLSIMSVRMDKKFSLQTSNINGNEKIPPGVLLTLVENGVTHGFSDSQSGTFKITKELSPGFLIYSIENEGETPGNIIEGTGLQYVRSRLKEAFSGSFSLELKKLNPGFQIKIVITK